MKKSAYGGLLRLLAGMAAAVLLTVTLGGCGGADGEKKHTREIFAMDTLMELTAYGDGADDALSDAVNKIKELEKTLSATLEGSDVYKINSAAGTAVAVSDETLGQIRTALSVSENSARLNSGRPALDITVYPLVNAWGFVNKDYRVPGDDEIVALLKKVDYTRVECGNGTVKIPQGSEIDLGAVAKGYTSQTLMSVLEDDGISSAIVSLGGNVQALGTKPDGSKWNVAIQDPLDADGVIGSVSISDEAVVTSGGYQRYFESGGVTYHHIFDPSTGSPARSGLLSTSVVCDDGTTADALSTALFVLGLDKALSYWRTVGGFEAIFVTEDGRIIVTDGIKDSFSPAEGTEYEVIVVSSRTK